MARTGNLLGSWAFLIGVILAIVLGIISGIQGTAISMTWIIVLVIIGLLVGLLNIASEEATPFLMSGVVLIIAANLGHAVLETVSWLSGILQALLAIFTPATVVVAIKNVFHFARD